MQSLHGWQLRLAVAVVVALIATGGWVAPLVDETFASQAWAGGRSGGNGHGHDDDDDDRKGRDKHKPKDFDHFACYTAAGHVLDKDVKIINQFTRDEWGRRVRIPITLGELVLLCVPTKKILIDEYPDRKHR